MQILALMLLMTSSASDPCETEGVRLQVLGSGGPEINDGRASTGYLLWHQDKARVLVDTGPGSAVTFDRAGATFDDPEAILLTHLHVDHSGDLPAYVKGAYFSQRSEDLRVLGPAANDLMPSTSQFVETLFGSSGAYRYLSNFMDRSGPWRLLPEDRPLDRGQMLSTQISEEITVTSVPTHHGPVAAVAWRVDVGDCRISFTGDTSLKWPEVRDLFEHSTLLVAHVAIPEDATGAAVNLHAKPSDGNARSSGRGPHPGSQPLDESHPG